MIVYWIMLLVVCLGGWFATTKSKKVLVNGWVYLYPHKAGVLIAFAALVIVSGLRSGTYDTRAYIMMFENVPSNIPEVIGVLLEGANRGPGFFVYQSLIKNFVSADFHFFLFITAFLSNFFIIITLYKYSPSLVMSLYLYITMGTFSWTMNGIRQFLAATVLFFCIRWIVEANWRRFFLVVILTSTVHFTALIMIPMYFFVRAKPWGSFCWRGIGIILLAILFFGNSLAIFFDAMEWTGISDYERVIAETPGTNILRALLALVPVVIAFIMRKSINTFNNPLLNVCVNFGIMNFLLMLLATRGGGLFLGRLCGYTEMYLFILFPYLFRFVPSVLRNYRYLLSGSFMGVYLIFYYYQMVITWSSYYVSDILFGSKIIQ